jgi:hypothetical protein
MKIRITTNNLRFRLSRGEVETLGKGGRLEEKIRVAEHELIYTLLARQVAEVNVQIQQQRLEVIVPLGQAHDWAGNFEVGIYAAAGDIQVAIEKDFKCLHGQSDLDQSDSFPNPLSEATR